MVGYVCSYVMYCFTQHVLKLGYILTARFRVLCTNCWCSLVPDLQCPLQRQSRPLQLLRRHHYMLRYVFPPYFTCFHKFLETVNHILTSSTNLQISAWMQDLLNRFIWIVIGQIQGPCLSDKYHLQLLVGLVIAKNLIHWTIHIRQRCWKVVIVVVFQCQS